MPGCPQCGNVWPDSFVRCPEDGAALAPSYRPSQGSMMGNAAPDLGYISDEDLPPGSQAGEYRIEKKIGEGGMGSVYGARHPLIGKRAAIKVIKRELSTNREAVDRFVLEAQSVNQIGHPNIVDVFGFGQLPDGRSFFVMEWLEGEALRDRLQRPLQFPEALETLEQIAKALQAAHDAGVVHRDLKPDNVYLQQRKGEKPTVKLLDFGLAKLTSRGDGGAQMDRTRTGMVMGTPLYLSPEQAKGMKIDAATDVYSLGAMAYEMLAGVVPFKADSAVEIMAMHISRPAIPLSDLAPWVPPEINALVLQMLEKDSRLRPSTAEVYERIGACRARASMATIGVHLHGGGGPAYTPPMHDGRSTPMPGSMSPLPGSMTPPPVTYPPMHAPMTPPPSYSGVGVSSMAPPAPGGKRIGLIIAGVLVAGGAVGAILFLAAKKSHETPAADQNIVAAGTDKNEPAPTPVEQAGTVPTPPAQTGSSAPAIEPPKADPPPAAPPATNPPATDPAKTDPVKTEPPKTDPPKQDHHAEPKRGRLVVTFAGPTRALIIVDGKPQGRETDGRATIELAPGDHTIRVQAKGFKPADTKVHVDAGGSRDVKLTLEKRKSVNAVHDPFDD